MDNRKHKQPEDLPERQTKGKRMQVSARPERWQQQLFGWQDHRGSQEGGSADKDVAPSRGFDDTHQAQANDSQQDQPRAKKRRMSQEEREMLPPVPIIAGDKEFELRWDKTAKENLEKMKKELPDYTNNLNEHAIQEMRSFRRQKSGAWSINHEKLSNDQKSILDKNTDSKSQSYRKWYERNSDKKSQSNRKHYERNSDKKRQSNKRYYEENRPTVLSNHKYKCRIVIMYRMYTKIKERRHYIESVESQSWINQSKNPSSRSQQSQAEVQKAQELPAKMEQTYHELGDLEQKLHVLYQEKAQRKANQSDQRGESMLQGDQPNQERGEGSNAPVQQAVHWAGMGSAEGMASQEVVGLRPRRPPLPDNWPDFLKSVQASPIGANLLKSVEKELVALSQAEHTESGAEPMATEGLQLPPEQSFPTNQDREIRDEWTDPHASKEGSDQHAGDIWDDLHIWKLLQTWENNHANSSMRDEMNELHNNSISHEMVNTFLGENSSNSGRKERSSTETGSDIEEVDTWLNLGP